MLSKLYSLSLLLLTGTLSAAMQPGDYPYSQTLELQSGSNSTARFGSFIVNEELFQELNPQASNLRIVDRNGIETPFLLRTKTGERTVTEERMVPFEKIAFTKLPENQIEIVLRNQDPHNFKTPLQSIVLATGIDNFEKLVSVFCSDNQQDWRPLAERRAIFDYSRYIDIRNNRIAFAPTAARYFKIEISNITEQQESPFTRLTRETRAGQQFSEVESSSFTRTDFRIDNISLYEQLTRVIQDRALSQPYTSSEFSVTPQDDNTTRITFRTARTPVTEITLLTETPDYHRQFLIETSADTKTWQRVHSGIFSSVRNDSAAGKPRTIALPHPLRADHYRITITNNDSPPLAISGLELLGETREVIFYCDQTNRYTVIYGAAQARAPLYDIAQVLPRTKSETTALYKAAPQQPNPHYGESASRGTTLSRRTVMTIAVILMIAVLGWLIAKTARSIGAE